MICPECEYGKTQVYCTRTVFSGEVIRRQRRCPDCGLRFTTYEVNKELFEGFCKPFVTAGPSPADWCSS